MVSCMMPLENELWNPKGIQLLRSGMTRGPKHGTLVSGQNADMVKKMWASTMEVFRATAEKRLHKVPVSMVFAG